MSRKKEATNRHKREVTAVATVSIILLLLVLDLTPLGGNIRFCMKWAQCGMKPVQVQSWGGIAWYEESPTFQPMLRNQSWYCSPIEAERAGYSASENNYIFPNLEKAGEPNPFLNS